MPEPLFDRAAEYEAMLNQGIGLSGESQDFFIAGRIQDLRAQVPPGPRRILDFGCGIGKSSAQLAEYFPAAQVVGAEPAEDALHRARASYSSERVTFVHTDDLRQVEPFDLCYINGVFHHILPAERQAVLAMIRNALRPGAHLALFENNPWNPGTRMVMRRIPFDRDAIPLSYLETQERVRQAGFVLRGARFLFYLPRFLAPLRFIEPLFVKVPLGAQYYVLATVPSSADSRHPQ